METKHTKGKWVSHRVYSGFYQILKEERTQNDSAIGILAHGEDQDQNYREVEVAANAKLIAAAPELLESLIECLEGVKELNGEFQDGWDEVISKAESAIKKAAQ